MSQKTPNILKNIMIATTAGTTKSALTVTSVTEVVNLA